MCIHIYLGYITDVNGCNNFARHRPLCIKPLLVVLVGLSLMPFRYALKTKDALNRWRIANFEDSFPRQLFLIVALRHVFHWVIYWISSVKSGNKCIFYLTHEFMVVQGVAVYLLFIDTQMIFFYCAQKKHFTEKLVNFAREQIQKQTKNWVLHKV